MTKRALVVLSDGFEDIEAVCPIDVLTRVGVKVTTASLKPGPVRGAWGATLLPDCTIDEIDGSYDAVIYPGGRRNAESLAGDERAVALARRFSGEGRLVAAICAAPSHVLGEAAGLLKDRRATGDPTFREKLAASGAEVTGEAVTKDGNIITATGPGSALLFAFRVAEELVGRDPLLPLAERWGFAF